MEIRFYDQKDMYLNHYGDTIDIDTDTVVVDGNLVATISSQFEMDVKNCCGEWEFGFIRMRIIND
jgi:hypothetical protein